jgi:hypothetical protein
MPGPFPAEPPNLEPSGIENFLDAAKPIITLHDV